MKASTKDTLTDVFTFIIMAFVFIGALAALCLGIGVGVRQLDHWQSKNKCDSRAEHSGFEVEFRDDTFWSFDCYAQVDGKWVPYEQVRLEVEEK